MSEWNWISAIQQLEELGKAGALCTVCFAKGSTPREVGAKMIVLSDGTIQGTIGGGHLEMKVIADALECLRILESKKFEYPLGAKLGQCCGGFVEVFIECITPGPHLYIFGAGHVGQAVCDTLKDTVFRIHLIDDRKEYVFCDTVSKEIHRHHCEWDDFIDEAAWDEKRTFAVVMTHRHDIDEAITCALLEKPARYIGLIGSHHKWTRFQARYLARGIAASKLARVQCPIGAGNLGKSPKAVAISLAAEILRVHHA